MTRHLRRLSHPTMGAWIEIEVYEVVEDESKWSHPTMGAWIEIRYDDIR